MFVAGAFGFCLHFVADLVAVRFQNGPCRRDNEFGISTLRNVQPKGNERGELEMKVDLYTKTVLTVIAVCLAVLVTRDIPVISEVRAEDRVVRVKIVDMAWPALPVKVTKKWGSGES